MPGNHDMYRKCENLYMLMYIYLEILIFYTGFLRGIGLINALRVAIVSGNTPAKPMVARSYAQIVRVFYACHPPVRN